MSKLTTAQINAYKAGGPKAFVKPVFFLYVIECLKTGGKYVTVRQNMSGEAFMRIVEADSYDDAQRIPLLWSVRRYGINAHEIKRVAAYTSKTEAREVMSRMIESIALNGISLNGSRPKVGASETFTWLPEAEAKKAIAARLAKKSPKSAKKATKKPAAEQPSVSA